MGEDKIDVKTIEVLAGRDKIVLTDVKIFERQEEGFEVENADNHQYGIIHSLPENQDYYSVGETVVIRRRTVAEKLVVQDTNYWFVQPLDILCKIR